MENHKSPYKELFGRNSNGLFINNKPRVHHKQPKGWGMAKEDRKRMSANHRWSYCFKTGEMICNECQRPRFVVEGALCQGRKSIKG